VLGTGAVDEGEVIIDHLRLDHRGPVDLRADNDVLLGRQAQHSFGGWFPHRVGFQVRGDDTELRPQVAEAKLGSEPEVGLQLPDRLVFGHPPWREAPGVNPGAVAGRFEPVAVQQLEPVIQPGGAW
jgi:hypothetical protein